MNIATKIAKSFVCDDYGDLYVIAESHEVDELAVLGNKFDDMLDLLKSTRNSLSFVLLI